MNTYVGAVHLPEIDMEEYEKIRRLLRGNLCEDLEKVRNWKSDRIFRRNITSGMGIEEERILCTECAGWELAVIYDDKDLFLKLTSRGVYLNTRSTNALFLYGKIFSGPFQNEDPVLNYDLIWYCASGNHRITERTLLRKLEEYAEAAGQELKGSALRELMCLADCYLKFPGREKGKDREWQKERADTFWKEAPNLAQKLIEYDVHNCGVMEFGMAELALWDKLIRSEAADGAKQSHAYQWYLSFGRKIINLHCEQPDRWFASPKDMMDSFSHSMSTIWELRSTLESGTLEVILTQWDALICDRRNSRRSKNDSSFGTVFASDTMMNDHVWKEMDELFRRLVVRSCGEFPESIADMIKRETFFPSGYIMRFLSCEICHGAIPVTMRYLQKRLEASLLPLADFDQTIFYNSEDDIQFFRWISVLRRRKRMSQAERKYLLYAPEDVMRAAGKAGLFSEECIDQCIDFSRRFGRIEVVPVLIGMHTEKEAKTLEE